MKIRAGVESLHETSIAGKLRQDPQLDLRIVSNDQLSSFRVTAETSPVFDRMRHLVNIRIRAGKPARRRADLAEVSMQTLRHGIDHLDHVLTVTRQRFLHGAIFVQRPDNWIFGRERLKLPVACRLRNGNAETRERPCQLLLRIEIDIFALWSTK